MRHLIIGGARSGKSALAERLARGCGLPVVYIATAEPRDREMEQRIARHRARRPSAWITAEAPLDLAEALAAHAAPQRAVIVDCLTLWVSNLIAACGAGDSTFDPARFEAKTNTLLALLPRLAGEIFLVSNEVGFGVVPMGPLTRIFVDETGRLNQQIADRCERVTLVVAGIPVSLKAPSPDG